MANLPNVGKSLKWIAACAVLVGGFEGLSTTTYHDKLAHGLPTVCYGETEGVKMGDHYTKQECLDMLANKLPRYWQEIEPSIRVQLSDNEKIAYTSFAYNLGSGRFITSSFLVKLNHGDHVGACKGMLVYDRSMGVVRKGLDNRRRKEAEVCLTIAQEGPVQRVVTLRNTAKPNPTPSEGADPYDCFGASRYLAQATNQACPVKPKDRLIAHAPPKPKPAPLVCTQFLFWRTCHEATK